MIYLRTTFYWPILMSGWSGSTGQKKGTLSDSTVVDQGNFERIIRTIDELFLANELTTTWDKDKQFNTKTLVFILSSRGDLVGSKVAEETAASRFVHKLGKKGIFKVEKKPPGYIRWPTIFYLTETGYHRLSEEIEQIRLKLCQKIPS